MDCASCEQLLLKHVNRVQGVSAAFADEKAGSLTVLAETGTSVEALAAAIVTAGFVPAKLGEDDSLVPVTELTEAEYPMLSASESMPPAALPVCSTPPATEDVAVPSAGEQDAPPVDAPAAQPPATRDATFAVSGMTCSSCAGVIEKVLGRLEGISSAVVNLASEKLAVTYDPAVIGVPRIIDAVKAAGYTATELNAPAEKTVAGRITLGLIGKTCSSSAGVIEKTLSKVPGVAGATVNLAANTGTVDFDPAVVGIDELIAAVKGAGYDAVVKTEKIPGAADKVVVQAVAQA